MPAAADGGEAEVSQYKVDFQPWKLERTQRVELRPQWEPPTGPVNGRTETADQFPQHPLEPRVPREKPQWRPPADKFSGLSVNKTDFLPKYQPKAQPVRPKDEIERAAGPFMGTSGSRDEFKVWEPQPRFRHEYPTYERPQGSMQLGTSYSADFAAAQPPPARLPPIRPEPRTQPQAPFRGVSESSERYQGFRAVEIVGAKQASCRPQLSYRPPSRPLDGRSSYAGDFGPGAGAAERARPVLHPGELQLPSDPMETSTTNRGDFPQPAAGERRQPIRRGGELRVSGEPFAGQSTQREDFSPRWQPRRQPIRHGGELGVSGQPFAGRSVMQDDFVARQGERPRPVRPAGELKVPDAPMVAMTTNRAVYTPKRREDPPPRRLQQQQVVEARG